MYTVGHKDDLFCSPQFHAIFLAVGFFFLRMRLAAMLLHRVAATSSRFPGTGWLGQWESPKVVRAWCTLTGCGPPAAHEHHTDKLLRGWGPSGTCWHRNDRLQCGGGSGWPTLYEGDPLLVGCVYQGGLWTALASSSLANHVSIAPLGWSWSLLGMLLGGWPWFRANVRACKRCEVSSRAFLTIMYVWCFLQSAGGAIPERTGIYFSWCRWEFRFLICMGAPAPYWGSRFCGIIDECEGACSESTCESSRGRASNTTLFECDLSVQFHPKVSRGRVARQCWTIQLDCKLSMSLLRVQSKMCCDGFCGACPQVLRESMHTSCECVLNRCLISIEVQEYKVVWICILRWRDRREIVEVNVK